MTTTTTARSGHGHNGHVGQTTYNRSRIQRAFKMRGLSIRVDACNAVENVLRRESPPEDAADKLGLLLDEIKKRLSASGTTVVTRGVVGEVVSELSRDARDILGESVQLLNAFETPRLEYVTMRRQFRLLRDDEEKRSLYGEAVDKVDMFAQRYALVHQRILRQDMFRPKLVTGDVAMRGARSGEGGDNTATCAITPVESLLGKRGVRTLLGMLVQVEEGRYYLEDITAQVPLDLRNCQVLSDGFISENCIVLVEGELHDGVLHASKIGHPPPEPRWDSIADSIGFERSDVFGAIPSASELDKLRLEEEKHGADGMFVLLSDVHLDDPAVLEKLERLFDAFQHNDPLPIFVLMGNFSSKSLTSGIGHEGRGGVRQMAALYEDLADLICRFPKLARDAKFVFVPGPSDPPSYGSCGGGHVLPQGPIPRLFTSALRERLGHVAFASNPCRIRFFTKELVFFRQSVVNKLGRNSILPLRGQQQRNAASTDRDDAAMETSLGGDTQQQDDEEGGGGEGENCDRIQHGIKTMLDQGHLCPLPLSSQPIYWQYDHSLRLFPLPDAVVVADSAGVDPFCRTYLDCVTVNPGSFPSEFRFVVFYPVKMQQQQSGTGMDEYDDDDASSPAVEFSQVD